MERRHFLRVGTTLAAGWSASGWAFAQRTFDPERRFRISLSPGAIGVAGSTSELLGRAQAVGFEALAPGPDILALQRGQLIDLRRRAAELGMTWGCGGLPVEFRQSEARFQKDLTALPAFAERLQQLGADRLGTWIMPGNDELDYPANFERHATRLRAAAAILEDNGIRLGLEYVGPKTLRDSKRYQFIWNGAQLRRLIAAIDRPTVGVVLDSFHWYTAEETVEDLRGWGKDAIVAVDLNDACAHFGPAEQIDGIRELPGATGVIDLTTFIGALLELGYDGPVRAEPFNDTLSAMDDDLAMRATVAALRRAMD